MAEDPLARPGVVTVNVAVPLEGADCARAVELIEQTRNAPPTRARAIVEMRLDARVGTIGDPVDDFID